MTGPPGTVLCPVCSTTHLTVLVAGIPEPLKRLNRWVVWILRPQPGEKPKKAPVNGAGYAVDAYQSANWLTFQDVVALYATGNFCGIGFAFDQNDGVAGVDLDGHVCSDGQLDVFGLAIAARLDSYTELSPSGTGVHILVRAHMAGRGKKSKKLGLEMYWTKRYFTVTGRALPGFCVQLNDRQTAYSQIRDEFFCSAPSKPTGNGSTATAEVSWRDLSDGEIAEARRLTASIVRKLEPLIQHGAPLYAAWNNPSTVGEGDDLDDSVVDFRVCGCLDALNWTRVEIVAADYVIRNRHSMDPEKVFRPDYVPRTIAVARETFREAPASEDRLLQWIRADRLHDIRRNASALLDMGVTRAAFTGLQWACRLSTRDGEFYTTKEHFRRQIGDGETVHTIYEAEKALFVLEQSGVIQRTGRRRGLALIYRLVPVAEWRVPQAARADRSLA